MDDFTLTIAGESVAAADSFEVIDPATEEVIARAPSCSREQLDDAMVAAQNAFASWSTDDASRRALMLQAAEALDEAAAEIAPLITAEQGKPLSDSRFEAGLPGRWLRHFAGLELPAEELLQDDAIVLSVLVRRPVGVVAAITPWNFPVYQAIEKIAPALRAGNTIVLKPSPHTPLSTLVLGERLRELLPPGVLNIVAGTDQLGEWMSAHPVPRKIAFTGSVATGKRVAGAASPDLKLVTLELGGNDPAIVLDDADVESIAAKIFWCAFGNCGQICNAVKRVYAPGRLEGELLEAFAELARAATVGPGSSPGVQIGPLNNRQQFERVKGLTSDALRHGATAVAGGGELEGPGFFFAPTVLRGVADGVRVVDEEQFGPVLPVISYDSLENAVERANGTHFGLSASVWSCDPERAATVADRLDAGTVGINSHMIGGERIPYGGVKWSGIGLVNGTEGLLGYTVPRVINRARAWEGLELPAVLEAVSASDAR